MFGKQSFIKGALILTIAGLTSRLIGAVFRIALAFLITDEGIGLYQMAYPIYAGLLIISTAGIPVAVSKLVSENIAVKNYYGAARVFKVALVILMISGLTISLALFLGAEYIVKYITRDLRALLPILSISPAIFFVAIMSAFRGFFQGQQTMIPTGASQIIEQFARVFVAFSLAVMLLPQGLEYAAAGATFGAVAGAVFGMLFLLILYFKQKRKFTRLIDSQKVKKHARITRIIYDIAYLAVPITLGNLVLPLISILDLTIVPQRLHTAGFTTARATALYGQLTGMATPITHIPAIITTSLAASLVPSISENLALNNQNKIRRNSNLAIRLTLILGLPAAIGVYILAEPITTLLFRNVEAAAVLKGMSFSVVFITLYQTSTGILQGLGRTVLPVKNMILGAVIKIVLTWFLTVLPQINIRGAAWATIIGFAIAAILNINKVHKLTGLKFDYGKNIIKPGLAAAVMGGIVYYVYLYTNQFLSAIYTASISNGAATILSIAAGILIYGIMLFITGSVTGEDLKLIPKFGPYLVRIADALHILKS